MPALEALLNRKPLLKPLLNRRFAVIHCRLALVLALSALVLPVVAEEPRLLQGSVTYMARIALPPTARLVVEARGLNETALGETRIDSEGAQVPLPFALEIPARVSADVRAAIFVDSQARWVSEPVALAPGIDPVELGEIMLEPHIPMGFTSALRCGDTRLRLGFAGDKALLDTGRRVIELAQVVTASGAKFQTADGATSVWTKADTASVELDGIALEECVEVPPEAQSAWTARGHEPGWALTIDGGRMTLTTANGAETVHAQLPRPAIVNGIFVYKQAEQGIRIGISETICRDSAIGRPHPQSVSVETGGQTLSGCGGDPMSLLAGPEWVVEDIAGRGLIDRSRVTLQVDREGGLSGTGGCNRYHGQLKMTGESLSIGPIASTMMACAEALMNQERAFYDALASVDGFDIDETGALLLSSAGKPVILARR
jgi:heat shock protein HslJ